MYSSRSGHRSPTNILKTSSRKAVARPMMQADTLPAPLFGEIENWRENPFFKQIEQDRNDTNLIMGRKFNLNLNPIEGETVFHVTKEHCKEIKEEIKEGTRKNIKWEPIELVNLEPHRWNSLELNKK